MPTKAKATMGPAGGAVKVRGKDDGCCGIFFLKYVLYIFHLILWISGGILLAAGIWTLVDKHTYISLLTSSTYIVTTYMLIGTGILVVLVGILGCFGACKENRMCLMTYATFLLLIFLLEAVIGALAYIYHDTVRDELVRNLNTTMLNNYKIDVPKTLAIDDLQIKFKCCGAESFTDWKYSRWMLGNRGNLTVKAPDSCCKSMASNCAKRDHPSNIYYDGCLHQLQQYLEEHLIILGAVGLGFCLIQLFGMVFACCLAKRIKEWEDRQQNAYAW